MFVFIQLSTGIKPPEGRGRESANCQLANPPFRCLAGDIPSSVNFQHKNYAGESILGYQENPQCALRLLKMT